MAMIKDVLTYIFLCKRCSVHSDNIQQSIPICCANTFQKVSICVAAFDMEKMQTKEKR